MPNPIYLVKVDPGANNNKFYKMIPNGNMFSVEYGRIGNTSVQRRSYSMREWDTKYREKISKGYEDKTSLMIVPDKKTMKYMNIRNNSISDIVTRLQNMAKQAIEQNYTVSSASVTGIMIKEAQRILNLLVVTNIVSEFNKHLVDLFLKQFQEKCFLYLRFWQTTQRTFRK